MDLFNVYYLKEIGGIVLKLVLAVVLGGIIGIEREHKHRPAGLRTHILVCVGACLTMMISSFMVESGISTDVARLGAQVISGIGFLGAGTIIREGDRVRGLTTAATLWAIACVGLAIGIGYYTGAVIASVLMLMVLKVLGYIMTKHEGEGIMTIHLTAKNSAENMSEITSVIHNYCTETRNIEFVADEEDKVGIALTVILKPGCDHTEFSSALIGLKDVYKVD